MNGLLIQWGKTQQYNQGARDIPYHFDFTNAPVVIAFEERNSDANPAYRCFPYSVANNKFSIYIGVSNLSVSWIAIGY